MGAPTTPADASRPLYKTTAEALQRDFQTNPDALARKIGNALVEDGDLRFPIIAFTTEDELALDGSSES